MKPKHCPTCGKYVPEGRYCPDCHVPVYTEADQKRRRIYMILGIIAALAVVAAIILNKEKPAQQLLPTTPHTQEQTTPR